MKNNEKDQKTAEAFNDYIGGLPIPSGAPCGSISEGAGTNSAAQHEESVALEFARIFRVFSIGGSLVFIGTHRSFETTIPNGTTFQSFRRIR